MRTRSRSQRWRPARPRCRFSQPTSFAGTQGSGSEEPEPSFVTRRLAMYWPSVLPSTNPLREDRRFVRPSRKDAGRHLCGRRNGVF